MSNSMPKTQWGGIADGRFSPTGFFRVGRHEDVVWLVDPDGGRFLSKGVDTVRFDQDNIKDSARSPYAEACQRKYGSKSAWQIAVANRLAGWGFNTLGSWSDEAVASVGDAPLAMTPNLDLGMSFAWQQNDRHRDEPERDFPDIFDPAFVDHIERRARERCGQRRDERNVLGWYSDNELRWCPDWRGPDDLLMLFLNWPASAPGRIFAIDLLRARYRAFEAFNSSWRTPARSWSELAALPRIEPPYRRKPPYDRNEPAEDAANRADPGRENIMADCDAFLALAAERYFQSTTAALKAVAPHHLVLGCRFAYPPPKAVVDAAARHVDVVSFNCYGLDANGALDAYRGTGKPCQIGEFSFRALDSGLPNSEGSGPMVATQAERAAGFRRYVTEALRDPMLVGYHWFEHADQPAEGRFDGENSNFGTVMIDDRVYEELTCAMTAVNTEAEIIHDAAAGVVTS
jgi:hypothetical protein